MRAAAVATLAASALLAVGPVALAQQSNPTSRQIINSLKPSGNIGTAPARPATPSAPAPAVAPATQPAQPATTEAAASPARAAPSVNLDVEFMTDSATLTPPARHTLDALGEALSSSELASYRFRIEGHTDTVGSASYNLALSQRRANAVAAYIEKRFGIAASRLHAVGMGEKGLLVPTPPDTPNARNRRVQVVNLGS